jgi:metal-sulfur cluster biosynthetic enzyme
MVAVLIGDQASKPQGGVRSVSDPEVLQALRAVNDPEIGINIVDLGLVYRAERMPEGIEVALTLSTRSCPLGELLIEEARAVLDRRFADTPSIQVELVWDPPWTPDRTSAAVRRQFG